MTDTSTIAPPSEQQALADLRVEAETMTGAQRAQHEAMIAELAAELALTETLQLNAQRDIDKAKELAAKSRIIHPEQTGEDLKIDLDLGKIGWLSRDITLELPLEKVEEIGNKKVPSPYYFADIVGLDNVGTRLRQKLGKATDAKLMTTLLRDGLPKLNHNIQRSSGEQRRETDSKAEYPTHKLEIRGNEFRAIVLNMGKHSDGIPVYILCALYNHTDQGQALRHFFKGAPKHAK